MSTPFEPIQPAQIKWQKGVPYAEAFNDIYFSRDDGLAESLHVFITGNKLIERWQSLDSLTTEFVIAETGFGSGRNFVLTWSLWRKYAPSHARLHFISAEKYPLTGSDMAICATLWPELNEFYTSLLAQYPVLTPGFHTLQFEDRVQLTLMLGEAQSSFKQLLLCHEPILEQELRSGFVNAWYLDGFAPAQNPKIWESDLFTTIGLLSQKNTTLSTYTCASQVSCELQRVGFQVSKIKGYRHKRAMLTAQFHAPKELTSRNKETPWHLSKPRFMRHKKAMVIGAGLAGCYTAHALAKKGWQVTILDAHSNPGEGASGNPQAVLYPKLSAFRSPWTEFMLMAYLFAVSEYRSILKKKSIGVLEGILQLAFNQNEQKSHRTLDAWLQGHPLLGWRVSEEEASTLAGVPIQHEGIFIPSSGWLDSKALCEFLCSTSGIQWEGNQRIAEIDYKESQWQAGNFNADTLLLAAGYQINQFEQTSYLPIKPIRGQMTIVPSSGNTAGLKIPLCGQGHMMPARKNQHYIGASYQLGSVDHAMNSMDDEMNIARLKHMLPLESSDVEGNWVGIRAATPDYLPLVGPVPKQSEFMAHFASLATNSQRWIPYADTYYPGLYVCSGFGSRGLTTIPLSAQWLATLMNHDFNSLPRHLTKAISPARFLYRKIIRRVESQDPSC